MIPILVLAVTMDVTPCGDTVQFKEGEFKRGEIVTQVVSAMPTSDCWQSWPGDSTAKFTTIRGDDSLGTFVIVMRTTKPSWFPMNVNRDKIVNIMDLMWIISRYLCYLFGRC